MKTITFNNKKYIIPSKWEDITLVEMNLETQETIDWDYSSVELSDIEEVL
jgi:hypothetical protein